MSAGVEMLSKLTASPVKKATRKAESAPINGTVKIPKSIMVFHPQANSARPVPAATSLARAQQGSGASKVQRAGRAGRIPPPAAAHSTTNDRRNGGPAKAP